MNADLFCVGLQGKVRLKKTPCRSAARARAQECTWSSTRSGPAWCSRSRDPVASAPSRARSSTPSTGAPPATARSACARKRYSRYTSTKVRAKITRRKRLKSMLCLRLKKRKVLKICSRRFFIRNFQILKQSHSAEKRKRGDLSAFYHPVWRRKSK